METQPKYIGNGYNHVTWDFLIYLSYVWFLESIKERKKNAKKNNFQVFGFIMENMKENKI